MLAEVMLQPRPLNSMKMKCTSVRHKNQLYTITHHKRRQIPPNQKLFNYCDGVILRIYPLNYAMFEFQQ